MGFGLPAAIGAQIATPDAPVIDFDGDHSFNMTMTELATAVQHELPIKVCIFNNGYMGMVRQWQELFYGRRYSCSHLKNPELRGGRPRIGAVGITVDKKADVSKPSPRCSPRSGPAWSTSASSGKKMSGRWSLPARASVRWTV